MSEHLSDFLPDDARALLDKPAPAPADALPDDAREIWDETREAERARRPFYLGTFPCE